MGTLHNRASQFQKSRIAAAITLGNLGHKRAIPLLKESLETQIFDLKYAFLLALDPVKGHHWSGYWCQ